MSPLVGLHIQRLSNQMSDQEYIRSLVKEAELYRSQGLLVQSKDKFLKVQQFIKKNKQFGNYRKLLDAVANKIRIVEKDLAEVSQETEAPKLSQDAQDLIKNLFSFSNNQDTAAAEGALALAKFGQYERALTEFHKLLKEGTLPLLSAKNIIRCHMALSSPDAAVDQFGKWASGDTLSKNQLKNVRRFLENVLKQKGIEAKLSEVVDTPLKRSETEPSEADVLDISSVRVKLVEGPNKDSSVEFDVTFQSGNIISVILSANQQELADTFKLGIRLQDMQFYSPIAIFRGSGVVSGKTKIKSGPKQGDYMLDIKIESA